MMPLRDHFHPPLSLQRHWHAFHNAWATYLAAHLNERLPEGYFAEPNVQFGIEIDVAAFDANGADAGVPSWSPPPPTQTLTLPAATDIVEVAVFHQQGGPTLAGAMELVSPANKDRPAHREAFAQKCATYLREGIGLAVIDVVTERSGNLHEALLSALAIAGTPATNSLLFAASYRPIERNEERQLDLWYEPLAIGAALPALPFHLRGGVSLEVDLESVYERTAREQRLT